MELALPPPEIYSSDFPTRGFTPRLFWCRRPGIYSPMLWYISFLFLIGGAFIGTNHLYFLYKAILENVPFNSVTSPFVSSLCLASPKYSVPWPTPNQPREDLPKPQPGSTGTRAQPLRHSNYPPVPSTPTVTSSVQAQNSHTPLSANTRLATPQKRSSSSLATT